MRTFDGRSRCLSARVKCPRNVKNDYRSIFCANIEIGAECKYISKKTTLRLMSKVAP